MRVIKIGGRAQSHPLLSARIAELWNADPGGVVVVHGGGDEISDVQKRLGGKPSFVDGRRVTTNDDIDLVRMVLSGVANKRIVSSLIGAGVQAVGISGEDSGMISAVPLDPELGRAGKPVSVNPSLLKLLLSAGNLPVVSPLARAHGETAGALNVNGDDAASAIAVALGADELLLIADVDGVLDETGAIVGSLENADAAELAQAGTVSRGMLAKLEAGFAALNAGVAKVRIGGLPTLSDSEAGTILTLTPSLR
ncbi:MAG TPA: acetylglutamate kinase [Gemmatimonadaceae bacterium]|jgi:acetylglutamate kinase